MVCPACCILWLTQVGQFPPEHQFSAPLSVCCLWEDECVWRSRVKEADVCVVNDWNNQFGNNWHVCLSTASWAALAFLRHLICISRLVSGNPQDHPWINTESPPDMIKLPKQKYLNNTDILMTPESVQIVRAWWEGWASSVETSALHPLHGEPLPGSSTQGSLIITARAFMSPFSCSAGLPSVWNPFSPFSLTIPGS